MSFLARYKNDILLVIAVLAVGLAAWLALSLFSAPGAVAIVTVDGEVYGRYPLDEDVTEEIETPWGSNTLVISGGAAAVERADCPDKICVDRGRISRDGESIICLPHRLAVTVSGGQPPEVDAVAE